MSSAADTPESARHRRVVEKLVHFAAVLLILVSLWLLRAEKLNAQAHWLTNDVFNTSLIQKFYYLIDLLVFLYVILLINK